MRKHLKALVVRLAGTKLTRALVGNLIYPEIARSLKWEIQPDEPSPSGLVESLAWKIHSYVVVSEEFGPTATNCSQDGMRSDQITRSRILDIVVREATAVKGDVLEFGVSAGESLRDFGERCPGRHIFGFDSFEGLPEAWWSRAQGAFKAEPPNIQKSNVTLVQGLFHESIPRFMPSWNSMASIVHVDCDLYSSTMACLIPIIRRIQPGTVVLFDEYYNYPHFAQHEWRAWREIRTRFGISATCIAYDGRRAAFRVDGICPNLASMTRTRDD